MSNGGTVSSPSARYLQYEIILTTTDPTQTAEALKAYAKIEGKPVLASWMGGPMVAAGEAILNRVNIPTFAYPDTAGSASATSKAPGSSDPTDGTFSGDGGTVTGGGTGGTGGSGSNSTTTTITLDDGTTITETITHNADGTITVTMCNTGGCTTFSLRPTTAGKEKDDRPWGRVSWKELIRP